MLPVDGSSDSSLLEMGIEFGSFEDLFKMRGARLPVGWTVLKKTIANWVVKDELGRERAFVVSNRHQTIIRPLRRFSHGRDEYADDKNVHVRFCVWDSAILDDREAQVVFEKGLNLPNKKSHKDAHEARLNVYVTHQFCEKWLSINWPNWANNNAYWYEEEKESK